MHRIVVTLKQHTPILHFQPMQEGATLRASEVKPKLDKFLLKELGDGDFAEGLKKAQDQKWTLGDSEALKYKMRVSATTTDKQALEVECKNNGKLETKQFPLILSNMGGKETEGEVANLRFCDECEITIIGMPGCSDDLFKYISSNDKIARFFALNNFGQRTSKGFGSFTVTKQLWNGQSKLYKESIIDFVPMNTRVLNIHVQKNSLLAQKYRTTFDVIDFFWKCIKSGVNYKKQGSENGLYIKSFLYSYLNARKNRTWEKREIKQTFRLFSEEKAVKKNNNTALFARALLGLPDKFEYKYQNNFTNKTVCKTVTIKSSNDAIARIPSPIIFKPIIVQDTQDNTKEYIRIYILIDHDVFKYLKEIQNTSDLQFKFSCNEKDKTLDVDPNILDLEEFVEEFVQFIKRRKSIYRDVQIPEVEEEELQFDEDEDDYSDEEDKRPKSSFIPYNFRGKILKGKEDYVKLTIKNK